MLRKAYNKVRNLIGATSHAKALPKQQRHDDVYLVSYPKSGNTWVSFLIANVINEYLELDMEVNFYNIHYFVPDIHISKNVPPDQRFKPFPRIIKSHSEYTPHYNNVFLLLRDPRDVMVSFYHYKKGLNQWNGSLSDLVKDSNLGIRSWVSHTEGWLEKSKPSQNIKLLFFEDFKRDPHEQIQEIFHTMGFNVDEKIISNAVKRSNLTNMKKAEEKTASYSLQKYEDFQFVRKGKTGEGKEELTKTDLNLIKREACEVIKEVGYDFT